MAIIDKISVNGIDYDIQDIHFGTTDISGIADGTLSGAISSLASGGAEVDETEGNLILEGKGEGGADGVSPKITVNSATEEEYTLKIEDKFSTFTTPNLKGADGARGEDGYSPAANVTKTADGAKITITDKTGTTEVTVKDGAGGAANLPYISVTDRGVSHAFEDQGPAIQAIIDELDGNAILYFEPGTYRIDTQVRIPSNTYLYGDNAIIIAINVTPFYIGNYALDQYCDKDEECVHVENVHIKGFELRSTDDYQHFIKCKGVNDITIEDIKANCGGVLILTAYHIDSWDGTPDPNVTGGMTSLARGNNRILIRDCYFHRTRTSEDHPELAPRGVLFEYCNNSKISNVTVKGFGQGIQLFGGDADLNRGGTTYKELFSRFIVVENCHASDCAGGGIWGGMIQDAHFINCYADTCEDMGFDFETCEDCSIVSCISRNCTQGNFGIYSKCKNILFNCITSIQDGDFNCHFLSSNGHMRPYDITMKFTDCSFITKGKMGYLTFASYYDLIVDGCYFENTTTEFNTSCVGYRDAKYCNNKFITTVACPNAKLLQVKSHSNVGKIVVENNTFDNTLNSADVAAIYSYNGDSYNSSFHTIKGNVITNAGIKCVCEGSNNLVDIIRENVCGGSITTSGNVILHKSGNINFAGTEI